MMKKTSFGKRTLALFLCVLMIGTCFSFSALSVYAAGEAVIGSTEYATFEEAVAAARNGDIIVINGNIVLEATVDVTKTLTIRSDGDAVISRAPTLTGSIFNVSGSLTLISVAVSGAGVSADSELVKVSGGTFTMREGSLITGGNAGGVYVESGAFNFYGGTVVDSTPSGNTNAVKLGASAVLRMSGSASLDSDSEIYMPASSYIEISGFLTGTSSIRIRKDSVTEGERIALLGGGISLPNEQVKRFVITDGTSEYNAMLDGNNLRVGKSSEADDEARIGDVVYKSLSEAFDAASKESSATVTLISDAVVTSPITVKGNITLESDGNFTVSASSGISGSALIVAKGSSLTVSDLDNTVTLSGAMSESGAALIEVQGSFAIGSSVVITGNVNKTETVNKGAVYVNGGSFNMTGGAVSGNTSGLGTVYVASGSFNMSGGSVYNNSATTAGGAYVEKGSFNLSGGSIYANTGEGVWTNGNFTLSGTGSVFSSSTYQGTVYLGGESKIKVASGWKPAAAPQGYTNIIPIAADELKLARVVAEFDGNATADNFTVSTRYENKFALLPKDKTLVVAAADEVYSVYWENNPYMTIQEALEEIPKGTPAKLRIVNDMILSATVVIKEGMNVLITTDANPATMADYKAITLKRSADFKDSAFAIEKGATLTLEAADGKELIFDGENKAVTRAAIVANGAVSLGKGVTIKGNNNKANETIVEKNPALTFGGGMFIDLGGSCTVNGAVITGNYASSGGGIYVKDAALTLSEGEIHANNALYGGGVYIETTGAKEDTFGVFNMAEGKLSSNKANAVKAIKDSGMGGGVYIGNGSSFMMSGGNLESNTADLGAGVCVGTAAYSKDKDIPEPKFVISDKANISANNSIYLSIPNVSHILVTSGLNRQSGAITISLPAPMPQNMKLVKFTLGDNALAGETAARNAFTKKQFVLDKEASEYYGVEVSQRDKSMLINTCGESEPTRAKTGKHHNGLDRYLEGDEDVKEGETKTEIIYGPVTVNQNGSFTAYYDFTYYPNIYKNINSFITAPFPIGTRIVMINTSDMENVGYYYYEVNGSETVVKEGESVNALVQPNVIEIPLVSFYKMGTVDSFYEPVVNEDTAKKAMTTEHILFVVDFIDVKADQGKTLEGSFVMEFNHYYPGAEEGERYDISANIGQVEYTVSNIADSIVSIEGGTNSVKVTYSLDPDSPILATNRGVIHFQLIDATFPRGTYFTDAEGIQYLCPGKSDFVSVPLPKDENGNILSSATVEYALANYHGTAMVNLPMRAVLSPSADGVHHTVGSILEAESEGIRISLEAEDEYAVLVSADEENKKPFYDSYDELKSAKALEMTVEGLINTATAQTFNLSLLKKNGKEYEACSLSELFNVSSEYGSEILLNTGKLKLDLRSDLDMIIGNEYKVAFKVGDAVEYVKVNVTKGK